MSLHSLGIASFEQKFSPKVAKPCPDTLFPLSLVTMSRRLLFDHSHWSPKHMAVYNFIQLISIPGTGLISHAFVTSKITCYTTKTLLDFVEMCSTIHCLHYICFITVFPCSYLMHFLSKLDHLRD